MPASPTPPRTRRSTSGAHDAHQHLESKQHVQAEAPTQRTIARGLPNLEAFQPSCRRGRRSRHSPLASPHPRQCSNAGVPAWRKDK